MAAQLQTTAEHMAGYRDLPMGRHDQRAMAAPEGIEAFRKFVRVEQDLLAMLRTAIERDQRCWPPWGVSKDNVGLRSGGADQNNQGKGDDDEDVRDAGAHAL